MMEYVGFIKDYDINIPNALDYDSFFNGDELLDNELNLIANYLESGNVFAGVMSVVYDKDKECIGPLIYLTDGKFVWPSYYLFFLRKYKKLHIDNLFLEFMKSRKFKIQKLEEEKLKSIDIEFSKVWSVSKPIIIKDKKVLLKPVIKKRL